MPGNIDITGMQYKRLLSIHELYVFEPFWYFLEPCEIVNACIN